MTKLFWAALAGLIFAQGYVRLDAQKSSANPCVRPQSGSEVPEPEDLRSRDGVLKVDLTIYNASYNTSAGGSSRCCYIDSSGNQSPNLRVSPGDQVILTLRNALTGLTGSPEPQRGAHEHAQPDATPCSGAAMTSASTNLHFHGLTIPAVCHQDDVLRTSINPGDSPFEYRFRIPENQPPGL